MLGNMDHQQTSGSTFHREPPPVDTPSSVAWSAFLNARLAYMEHQPEVTRVAVQSAYRSFACAMGLTRSDAEAATERLNAINGWEQDPSILIGAIH